MKRLLQELGVELVDSLASSVELAIEQAPEKKRNLLFNILTLLYYHEENLN